MTSEAVSLPGESTSGAGARKDAGTIKFGPAVQATAYWLSIFLVVFPPLAVFAEFISSRTVLVSVPLFLMFVCGFHGTRLMRRLEKERGR